MGELGRITGDTFGELTRRQMAFAEQLGELMREAGTASRGERPDPVAALSVFQRAMDAWIHHLHVTVQASLEAQRKAMELVMERLLAAGAPQGGGGGSAQGGASGGGGRGRASE
ncbi:hypothetical protein HRbin39_00473 [bacterium HR39]|nr:hypothetical protein HRbin39_00473 [bacterium HR39]